MFWFIFFTTEFGEELEFYAQQKLEDFATKAFLKIQNQMQKSQWKHEDSFLSCFLPSSRDKTKTQTSWLKLFSAIWNCHGWSHIQHPQKKLSLKLFSAKIEVGYQLMTFLKHRFQEERPNYSSG
jgi:hypothetical protein